nr:hypothetical protein [Okeania sp. SIO2F4]
MKKVQGFRSKKLKKLGFWVDALQKNQGIIILTTSPLLLTPDS